MNIALENTAEYVNGAKRRTYGDAFVRGNNGEFFDGWLLLLRRRWWRWLLADSLPRYVYAVMYICADS